MLKEDLKVSPENEATEALSTSKWPIERATNLLGGTMILLSLALGRAHSRRWRLLTAFVGTNLVLNAAVGWCPASLIMRRLGMPNAVQCARR